MVRGSFAGEAAISSESPPFSLYGMTAGRTAPHACPGSGLPVFSFQ